MYMVEKLIDGLSVKVKATCLRAGQWTDADGDKAVIEFLKYLDM